MAGSDTLATARTLAMALEQEACDLIFCGRHSTDAETGQVGPELAEVMGLPHVSNVYRLDYEAGSNSVLVERETDDGHEVVRCPLPAVICVTEGIMPERFPNREQMEAGREKPIVEVGAGRVVARAVAVRGCGFADVGVGYSNHRVVKVGGGD